jgi:hypothetical protein
MSIREIEPFGREEDQFKRAAARRQLHFHIDQFGYLTEHAGCESESRVASDAELQMWHNMCPELPVPCWPRPEIPTLDATPKELADCLFMDEPYTLNAQDVGRPYG